MAVYLTPEWRWWPDVVRQAQEATAKPTGRAGAALYVLLAAGIAERGRHGAGTPQIRPARQSGETG